MFILYQSTVFLYTWNFLLWTDIPLMFPYCGRIATEGNVKEFLRMVFGRKTN
jgi:hypothetical protein